MRSNHPPLIRAVNRSGPSLWRSSTPLGTWPGCLTRITARRGLRQRSLLAMTSGPASSFAVPAGRVLSMTIRPRIRGAMGSPRPPSYKAHSSAAAAATKDTGRPSARLGISTIPPPFADGAEHIEPPVTVQPVPCRVPGRDRSCTSHQIISGTGKWKFLALCQCFCEEDSDATGDRGSGHAGAAHPKRAVAGRGARRRDVSPRSTDIWLLSSIPGRTRGRPGIDW